MTTPSPEQLQLAPWMRHARAELGVRELPGEKHSPRVLEYIASCDGGTRPWAAKDETAWCSAFVNWCMQAANLPRTRKLNARSWLTYGDPVLLHEARYGDIVVFWRGVYVPASVQNAPGHVAFFDGWEGPRPIDVLGGNQGNRVSIPTRPTSKVLAVRRPTEAALKLRELMRSEA